MAFANPPATTVTPTAISGTVDDRRPRLRVAPDPHLVVVLTGGERLFRDALRNFLVSRGHIVIATKDVTELEAALQADGEPNISVYCLGPGEPTEQRLADLQTLRKVLPGTRTLVLATDVRPSAFARLVSIGIDGLLVNDISAEALQQAIHLIILGQKIFPPVRLSASPDTRIPVAANDSAESPTEAVEALHDTAGAYPVALSERESQVLSCLVAGLSNKVIASKLQITDATVKVRVKTVLRKLQVSNRTQAAIWAVSTSTRRQA